jgi:hypothetical protein
MLLTGMPSRWATAVQLGLSLRQSSMATYFCLAVNRSLVLLGLAIDGQSEGHGVTPINLPTKPGQPHPINLFASAHLHAKQVLR